MPPMAFYKGSDSFRDLQDFSRPSHNLNFNQMTPYWGRFTIYVIKPTFSYYVFPTELL